eukprot:5489172-Pleurochrysis_carterae.AAC.1
MLSDAAIGWGMKKQQSVALSTCQAEIIAGSLAACEAPVYLRDVLTELGFPPPGPTKLRMDNSGAINLGHDPLSQAKSKRIHRRELKIHESVADGIIKLKNVKSKDNTADIFTKLLGRVAFQKHRATLLALRNYAEMHISARSLYFRAWRAVGLQHFAQQC